MRLKFFDIFSKVKIRSANDLKPLSENIPKMAVRLEMALQRKHSEPRDYASKARSLIFNLNDPKNPNLKLRVLSGSLECKDLIVLNPKQLASDDLKQEREKIQENDLNARRTDWQ